MRATILPTSAVIWTSAWTGKPGIKDGSSSTLKMSSTRTKHARWTVNTFEFQFLCLDWRISFFSLPSFPYWSSLGGQLTAFMYLSNIPRVPELNKSIEFVGDIEKLCVGPQGIRSVNFVNFESINTVNHWDTAAAAWKQLICGNKWKYLLIQFVLAAPGCWCSVHTRGCLIYNEMRGHSCWVSGRECSSRMLEHSLPETQSLREAQTLPPRTWSLQDARSLPPRNPVIIG